MEGERTAAFAGKTSVTTDLVKARSQPCQRSDSVSRCRSFFHASARSSGFLLQWIRRVPLAFKWHSRNWQIYSYGEQGRFPPSGSDPGPSLVPRTGNPCVHWVYRHKGNMRRHRFLRLRLHGYEAISGLNVDARVNRGPIWQRIGPASLFRRPGRDLPSFRSSCEFHGC